MADKLDRLVKRGLCTRAEIAVIRKRRRDFEDLLKRTSSLKEDILRYIEFEKKFDRLLYLKNQMILDEMKKNEKEREGIEKKKKRKKRKKWIPNADGVRRILGLYSMATNRNKGDLKLWFEYLEFCKERRHQKVNEVLAQVIGFHARVPRVWIYAAAWEFDHDNVVAARDRMQKGLRVCPNSEDFWIEYLRMELTYLNKLKAQNVALEEVREVGDVNILQTIYHGAVKAIPSSMSFRKRFLEVLDTVNLAHSDELRKEVMKDLKKDFSHDELYWEWIASQENVATSMDKDEFLFKLNKVIAIYEEAVDMSPSSKMFSLYTKFWFDTLAIDKEDSNSLLNNFGIDATDFTSFILEVFKKAESIGHLSEDTACRYISFYLKIGRIEEAINLAKKLCNERLSEGAELWALRISIEVKQIENKAPMSKDELSYVFDLFKNVLNRFSICKAERLWTMALEIFSNEKGHFEKLIERFMWQLPKAGGGGSGDSGSHISSAIVDWVFQRKGIQHARDMYKRFIASTRPNLAFYKYCIQLETNLALVGGSVAVAKVRWLYESALFWYDQNKELWREYYTSEMKIGTLEKAYAVYWRAQKALEDFSGFNL